MTISAAGDARRRPRRGSTSSATETKWNDEQRALWKAVGRATGWEAGEVCRRVQISELFSIEKCDQAVMDFLAATEVGKLQRR